MILGGNAVYRFAGADSIGVVGMGNRVITMRDGGQPSPVLPSEGEAVTVGEGVADLIIGDSLAVKAGQQICLADI